MNGGGSGPSYRVGVDIGGTFTDLCLSDETGVVAVGKILTTPHDPSEAVLDVLRSTLDGAGLGLDAVQRLVHGTTLVTNAILERKGSTTALLATRGFRDAVEIARERRYQLYDLMVELPKPLAPRHLRFDVPERILSDGTVAESLDTAFVERLGLELTERGVGAVAVAFLHSYTNPEHEQAAGEILRRVAPDVRLSLSSEVVPEIREYERTSTTLANAYVQDIVERYLGDLEERLRAAGFDGHLVVMLSGGGVATVETAVSFPIRMLESGPAAGALAAASYGIANGEADLLSFDMGGTTAKLCVVENGEPLITHDFEVDRVYRLKRGSGLPVRVPVIDMIEIGVGGGSIARVNALGLLAVGPDSAGADPGPVCYGRGGTRPTITDADLLLGYLDPAYFLGGRMSLDVEGARAAVEREVAGPLELSVEEAAWGIHQIANENMAIAARAHAVERGKNPLLLPLFAFGGAGPLHAVGVANALGARAVIVPFGAGVMSAIGFLTAPLAFDFVRSFRAPADRVAWEEADALFTAMEAEGCELLERSGVSPAEIAHNRLADIRFVGQGHELRVPVPASEPEGWPQVLLERFASQYREIYGHEGPSVPAEVLNWRVVSTGPRPELDITPVEPPGAAGAAVEGERLVYFREAGGLTPTRVLDRYALEPGTTFDGPAVVQERESTLIVPPGYTASVTSRRGLVVRREAA